MDTSTLCRTSQPVGDGSHRLIVGVDGSDASIAALRWAERNAAALGARVEAVYVYAYPRDGVSTADPAPEGILSRSGLACVKAAEQELSRAVRRAVATPSDSPLATFVVPNLEAAQGLVGLATPGDLLVVGGHAPGQPRLLGSTSSALLRDAPCPVIVVPGTE